MNGRPTLAAASGNPLAQLASLLAFGLLLVIAVVMGAVILAVVLGLAVLAAIGLWLRLWWLRRKLGRAGVRTGDGHAAFSGRLIEAEYTVVEKGASPGERDP